MNRAHAHGAPLLLIGCLVTAACSQPPPADLPHPVSAALTAQLDLCREVGGAANAGSALGRADLNTDGMDDFVLFTGWIRCENAWSVYGDRLKGVQIFVADSRGNALEAFTGSAYDVRIETTADGTRLWLTLSDLDCGRSRTASFAEAVFCERPLVWDAVGGRFDYAPLGSMRLIE